MPVPATPVDPRASFNYTIEIEGLEAALASTVQIPDLEIGKIEHNGAGSIHSTKTGGRMKFGDVTIEKAMYSDTTDKWAWLWLSTVRSIDATGLVAAQYKKKVSVLHYGPNTTTVIDRWDLNGAWVQKIAYAKNDSGQDEERFMETVTLSIDNYMRI